MSPTDIRFVDQSPDARKFFSTLRQRVDGYFKENGISRNSNATMHIKTVVLLSLYLLPIPVLMLVPMPPLAYFSLWLLMGFAVAGVGMSVMHDANHGAYSKNHRTNFILGSTLNLLGGSMFNWKIQHNLLHHTYTNITHKDDDIDDKLILRFSPHTPTKWYHKLQFIYAFAFYCITTLYWVFLKDFFQFQRYLREGYGSKHTKTELTVIFLKILMAKAFYIFLFLFMPLVIFNAPAGAWFAGFLLMHFTAGLILTVIFQLAHTVEGTTHPLPDENNTIENNWAIHQLNTTVNFATKNKFLTWYLGGLNYQVEHHLFPNICHVHYPQVSNIVKSTCAEFGVPYLENRTFGGALKSHVATLKRFGASHAIEEALA
jgi:linoleoyl-CoA desaturase